MKITKQKLKELIMDELREMNIYHNTDGEWSDKEDAKSISGPGVGQREWPGRKDKAKCGRAHPSRKKCKKIEGKLLKPDHPVNEDDFNREQMLYLQNIVKQAIQQALANAAKGSDCSFSDLVRAQTIWTKAQKGGDSKK